MRSAEGGTSGAATDRFGSPFASSYTASLYGQRQPPAAHAPSAGSASRLGSGYGYASGRPHVPPPAGMPPGAGNSYVPPPAGMSSGLWDRDRRNQQSTNADRPPSRGTERPFAESSAERERAARRAKAEATIRKQEEAECREREVMARRATEEKERAEARMQRDREEEAAKEEAERQEQAERQAEAKEQQGMLEAKRDRDQVIA